MFRATDAATAAEWLHVLAPIEAGGSAPGGSGSVVELVASALLLWAGYEPMSLPEETERLQSALVSNLVPVAVLACLMV